MKFRNSLPLAALALAGLLGATSLQAATITPNIFTDPPLVGPGVGTDCSLRYAIQSINTGALEGGCANSGGGFGSEDTIVLNPGDYLLTISGFDEDNNSEGDLDVLASLILQGPGSDPTSIDASGIDQGDRILDFIDEETTSSVIGVTITGGDVTNAENQFGGGIRTNAADLTLDDVRIIDNQAGTGGGLATATTSIDVNPLLTINNSTIDSNIAETCGGILLLFSTAGISNSTISNNQAQEDVGGGLCQGGNELFLTNSTISGNTAVEEGGGILTIAGGSPTNGLKGAYNVTIAFNEAGVGGGIAGDLGLAPGGIEPTPFPTRIFNSIIAQNTAPTGADCANGNFLTGGFNLIGQIGPNDNCTDFNAGSNDQVGTPEAPIDPLLGPLADNGGPTQTHALLVGSPAIDRGNPDGCQAVDFEQFVADGSEVFNTLTTDQRALTRPVAVLDPNVPICDIGAYEFQVAVPTPTPTPTPTPIPGFQGFVEGGGCSLNPAAATSAAASLWIGLGLIGGLWGLKSKTRD